MTAKYDDLLKTGRRSELTREGIYLLPHQFPRNLNVQRALGGKLGDFFQDGDHGGPGTWWIFPEPDVQLSGETYEPDIAGWLKTRLESPDQRPILVTPDWVCEVVSEDLRHDYVKKMGVYGESQIPYYWIVNAHPDFEYLETYEFRQTRFEFVRAYKRGDVAEIPPFTGLELNINSLFLPRSAYLRKT